VLLCSGSARLLFFVEGVTFVAFFGTVPVVLLPVVEDHGPFAVFFMSSERAFVRRQRILSSLLSLRGLAPCGFFSVLLALGFFFFLSALRQIGLGRPCATDFFSRFQRRPARHSCLLFQGRARFNPPARFFFSLTRPVVADSVSVSFDA